MLYLRQEKGNGGIKMKNYNCINLNFKKIKKKLNFLMLALFIIAGSNVMADDQEYLDITLKKIKAETISERNGELYLANNKISTLANIVSFKTTTKGNQIYLNVKIDDKYSVFDLYSVYQKDATKGYIHIENYRYETAKIADELVDFTDITRTVFFKSSKATKNTQCLNTNNDKIGGNCTDNFGVKTFYYSTYDKTSKEQRHFETYSYSFVTENFYQYQKRVAYSYQTGSKQKRSETTTKWDTKNKKLLSFSNKVYSKYNKVVYRDIFSKCRIKTVPNNDDTIADEQDCLQHDYYYYNSKTGKLTAKQTFNYKKIKKNNKTIIQNGSWQWLKYNKAGKKISYKYRTFKNDKVIQQVFYKYDKKGTLKSGAYKVVIKYNKKEKPTSAKKYVYNKKGKIVKSYAIKIKALNKNIYIWE